MNLFDKAKVFKPDIRKKEDNLHRLVTELKHWDRMGETDLKVDVRDSLIKFLQINYAK